MKASRQFQKQSASSATPISQTSKRLQTRPFRDPNAPTTAQSSQSSLPAPDYDPSSRPAWWDRLTFNPQRPSTVQAKLTVGAPNDQYEQEADRVADQVMSMPDAATQQPLQRETLPEEELQTKPSAAGITPLVQREAMPEEEDPVQAKASGNADIQREAMPEEEEVQTKPLASGILQREEMAPEEEDLQMKPLGTANLQREAMPEEEDALQTKSLGTADLQREALPEEDESLQTKSSPTPHTPHSTPPLESQLSNTQGSGSPLSDDVRSFMEPRFGADFSQVRVHTGSDAVQMNRDLNAQAFTHKQDVYFGAGKSPTKDALTAHELTHVVQQTSKIQHVQRDTQDGGNNQAEDDSDITLTLSVDRANGTLLGLNDVGHAWIRITTSSGADTYGFYPEKHTLKALWGSPGIVHNPDLGHDATDFKMVQITTKGLKKALSYAEKHSHDKYSLLGYSCVSFARGMFKAATGLSAPFAGHLIADPKDLAKAIQDESIDRNNDTGSGGLPPGSGY